MRWELGFLSIQRKAQRRYRQHDCEPLEQRLALNAADDTQLLIASDTAGSAAIVAKPQYDVQASPAMFPGGLLVTSTQIITETDTIPRFAGQPTITTLRGGNWSDPSIWSLGRAPTDGDRVAIAEGTVVSYSQVSNARLDALEISGSLIFSTVADTRLTVANVTVMPSGTLQIGTPSNPVSAQVKAELVIADKPLDVVNDPRQYGTGLIALGTVTIVGSPIAQTWSRLASEPRAGDRSIVVAGDVSNWRPGGTVVLPDTRQVLTTDAEHFTADEVAPQWEEVLIDRVVGNRVYLQTALQFNHRGARNAAGVLELLPHVALLDRNVVIRSENPDGVRGHTFYTARARVDIEYARFQDLGRTSAFAEIDNTTLDADGHVTHFGVNQIGRYAIHFHHMAGPENPSNTGYQFKFIGNTVDGSRKWAVATHDTSFGLLQGNVVYDAQGAGFVTEDGSEIGNLFKNNITIRIQGTHEDGKYGTDEGDYGRGGSGFWFRRAGNTITGNVAADSTYAGFVIDGYSDLSPLVLPKFRGAQKNVPGQGIVVTLNAGGFLGDNEAYGMTTYGLWMAFPLGDNLIEGSNLTRITNLRLWNIHHSGIVAYHTNNVYFDKVVILADRSRQDRNDAGTYGMDFQTYENRNLIIRNSRIEGARIGIVAPRNDSSEAGIERPTIIENTTLKNYINIVVFPPNSSRPSNGNSLVVRDVKFTLVSGLPPGPLPTASVTPAANIYLQYTSPSPDLTQPSVVRVYNYNQVLGDNFQVFYREQASTFIMPQTNPARLTGRDDGLIGSPAANLTNLANWQTYGIATAGGLLPAGATASRPEINGMVGPIQIPSTVAPRVVIVTPWEGAQMNGDQPMRLRYNVNGALSAGASVYFSLDGGPWFTKFTDGGLFNVPGGQHTLRAYVGNSLGQLWPGTSFVTRTFSINLTGGGFGGIIVTSQAVESTPAAASGRAFGSVITTLADSNGPVATPAAGGPLMVAAVDEITSSPVPKRSPAIPDDQAGD